MSTLAILVLHGMGDTGTWLKGVADVELMFPEYDKENRYLVHSAKLPLPEDVTKFTFSAIIMTSTFMDRVVEHGLSSRWIRQYDFLKNTTARKIVFPQDDYWQCEVRDRFYVEWGIDEIFPVCQPSSWYELIPRSMKAGIKINQGYTTYVTPLMLGLSEYSKSWSDREFDVVYRASRTPTAPNRLGMIKSVIGDRFIQALGTKKGFKFNISDGSGALIVGSDWHRFIGNSRAILGSNSGSSIRLRNSDIARTILNYQLRHPELTMDQLEEATVPAVDRGKNYTAISPRNVEAAMLNTLQILVPGDYSGILKPHEHYIPLDEKCSNIKEVLDILKDEDHCRRIVNNCKNQILCRPELNSYKLISNVLSRVATSKSHLTSFDMSAFSNLNAKYNRKIYFFKLSNYWLIRLKNIMRPLMPLRLKLWLRTLR